MLSSLLHEERAELWLSTSGKARTAGSSSLARLASLVDGKVDGVQVRRAPPFQSSSGSRSPEKGDG